PKYVPLHNYKSHTPISLGKWEYTIKSDSDVVVLACGALMNDIAMKLYDEVGGFSIVNARFVKPLDSDMLDELFDKKILTMEDNMLAGGFGSAVLEYYNSKDVMPKIKIKAVNDKNLPHASMSELLDMCGFGIAQLKEDIKSLSK
ncbi:MAG: hypothetical protein K2I79_02730, partial [Clostridia bacterium]|nr:hypothetical protein [Clostridia bacterium]